MSTPACSDFAVMHLGPDRRVADAPPARCRGDAGVGGRANSRGGIRVAVKDLDGDKKADLVVGSGTGAGSRVTGYLGKNIATDGTPTAQFDFDSFAGFTGGVFVG